jgi:membrane-bound serine protease (ClpP class)
MPMADGLWRPATRGRSSKDTAPSAYRPAVPFGSARRLLGAAGLLAGILALAGPLLDQPAKATEEQPSDVLVSRVEGPITPVIADHLVDGVRAAERQRHAAFVVELDTPGGLDAAMREIIQAFLGAGVPVVVHVTPAGARAASAGALITMAAHVAVMAPGTTIGAATPVDLQGGEISDKVINDAASFAEAVAAQRGRSRQFAIQAVREGRSVTAERARQLEAVDLLAADRAGLLRALDGRQVQLAPDRTVTMRTADAGVVEHGMGPLRSLLQRLADPNLAFLFLSIGTLALIYELASPGMGLGGVLGTIMLVLGFVALSVLPVNLAGLLLLGLAAALFVGEVLTPGVGVFAAGGTIALLAAGLLLFEGSVQVSPAVLWPTALVIGTAAVVAGRLAWRARRGPSVSGVETLAGRQALVRRVLDDHTGQVMLDGSWWTVYSRTALLKEDQPIVVTAVDGVVLLVESINHEEEPS